MQNSLISISLLVVILILLIFFILNFIIYFITTSTYPLRPRIPFIIISYSIGMATIALIIILIFHIHIDFEGFQIIFHIHELTSSEIMNIGFFKIDMISLTIIIWGSFICISGLILPQIAFNILLKSYLNNSLSLKDVEAFTNIFDIKTNQLLEKKGIKLVFVNSKNPFILSISFLNYYLKKQNFIIVTNYLANEFEKSELEAGILHEIGHIIHLDTVYYPILNAISKVMFFDPILKKVLKKYHEKIEIRADNYAISQGIHPKILANSILKLNKLLYTNNELESENISLLTPNPGKTSKNLLFLRIKRILNK